jgi:hypothetical protein
LDIETGESATDYEDIAKQEHLSGSLGQFWLIVLVLEIEVRKLNDRLRDVRAEQNYQRVCLKLMTSEITSESRSGVSRHERKHKLKGDVVVYHSNEHFSLCWDVANIPSEELFQGNSAHWL